MYLLLNLHFIKSVSTDLFSASSRDRRGGEKEVPNIKSNTALKIKKKKKKEEKDFKHRISKSLNKDKFYTSKLQFTDCLFTQASV